MEKREDTMVRVDRETKDRLTVIRAEMVVASGQPIRSDDEAIRRLIEHWERTKLRAAPCGAQG